MKFGEVVRQVKDKVDPASSGLTRFVAGEHMDTDDLRIRRWGEIGDGCLGPAFHARFRSGQVLYGSRRTYLRKVAVADFDGICANTTFVLESANPTALLPGLLPFVMQSDSFHEHSKRESKGSVNPYVNFSDLAWYEFPLPPFEEQPRILRFLSAMQDAQESIRHLSATSRRVLDAAVLNSFASVTQRVPLQSLCCAPITYGIVQAGPDTGEGIPYLRVSEMTDREELDPLSMMRTSREISASYQRTVLELGDIVVALRGVPGLCHIVREDLVGANLSRGVARVAPSQAVSSRFLLWALRSPHVQSAVLQYANGWKGEDLREITIAQIRTLPVPVLPSPQQKALVERLDLLQSTHRACRDRLSNFEAVVAKAIQTALMGAS